MYTPVCTCATHMHRNTSKHIRIHSMRLGWAKDEPGSNACLCRFKLENVSKLIPTLDL